MIGHEEIIEARLNGMAPKDVFFYIRDADVDMSIYGVEQPDVFTEKTLPKNADLRWMHGLVVHLIPGPDTTNEEYLKWWLACIEAKPKFLIGIDPDGELNTWN
jgi:hypothetical protein